MKICFVVKWLNSNSADLGQPWHRFDAEPTDECTEVERIAVRAHPKLASFITTAVGKSHLPDEA
ncbi:MAG: hypothetical protein ACXWIP_02775, partial [Burkholderiales bacterium]